MKKILVGIIGAGVVGVSILGTNIAYSENRSKEANPVEETEKKKVVYTFEDEERKTSGSLSDAINATSLFLYGVLENDLSFEEDKDNLQVVDTYAKGAVKWAEKANASEEIKTTLNEAADLIEKGIKEEDLNSLKEASDKLLELDKSYHGKYWKEYGI